jgi:hypothetical protein
MRRLGGAGIMRDMTRPAPSSRLLLIADRRPVPPGANAVPVRRYRLARLRFESRSSDPASRFEHLKQTFD